ncbi:transcription repressor NadR [Thermanaeromonas sp. C210]|uniref:transcription repressor NadR n=1 Tax=Thermanaeromonas sp. C210 TaxID=2731925 RepID=UPI00155C39AD|nr:transcription repressor NadR [Thermanaeromonas sp. C210]GFN22928.1 transcriptional regulator [Thermanaeromonas sp. C210]
MKAAERREKILAILGRGQPVTGAQLARWLGVSRQVIVQDVAILRARGSEVLATPQGYVLPLREEGCRRTFACRHDLEGLERELLIMVDNGGKVMDVVVEHPLYGELRGYLMLSSRREVYEFINKLKKSGANPLYTLTGSGVHLHTVVAPDEATLEAMERELLEAGILLG